MTADQIYDALALPFWKQVMARFGTSIEGGQSAFFEQMKKMLMDDRAGPSKQKSPVRFDMTENAVKQAFFRFLSVTKLYSEEISHTLHASDIEDELRHLIAVVGRRHELHRLDTNYTNYHE